MSEIKFYDLVPVIGEVYMMEFKGAGTAQSGWRPGVVLQNNIGKPLRRYDQALHQALDRSYAGSAAQYLIPPKKPFAYLEKNMEFVKNTL